MLSLNKNYFPIFSYSGNYNVIAYIFSTRLNKKNIKYDLTIFNGDMWIVKCSERQMLERNGQLESISTLSHNYSLSHNYCEHHFFAIFEILLYLGSFLFHCEIPVPYGVARSKIILIRSLFSQILILNFSIHSLYKFAMQSDCKQ